MAKNGLISVIVPIYGVEKYLEECIESVIRQTYANLEIILVDDGSPDRCGAICDRYAKTDSRITVVHKKNGGAASAKNAGLRISSGEYVTILDGDDYLEPDAYENMVAALLNYDADIVQGRMNFLYVDRKGLLNGHLETVCYSATEYLTQFLDDWTCPLCTEKLFRRDVLADIFFEEGHCIDDEFFTYKGVMNAGKIVCIPKVVYNYRQRASSVMKDPKTLDKKCDDILEFLEKRCRDVSDRFPELKSLYEAHYADYLLWLAKKGIVTETAIRKIKRKLVRYVLSGKVLFWKAGQRKRTLNIFIFFAKPARSQINQKIEVTDSGYQLFE